MNRIIVGLFVLVLAAPLTARATDCRPIFNDAEALEDVTCCDVDLPVFVGFAFVPNYVVGCESAVFRDRFHFSKTTCLSRGHVALTSYAAALSDSDTPPYLEPWSRDCSNLPVGDAFLLENDIDEDGFPASEDCNDNSAAIHPGATELCDGVDNDCDGTVDEGLPQTTWYRDRDGDGYGSLTSVTQCASPSFGYVTNHNDCHDSRGDVYPGAPEICDEFDNDCDGEFNEESDVDGDGFTACASSYSYQDCNDNNPAVFPGMIEITCNGIDDDCNPSTPDQVNCPPETDGPGWSGPDSFPGDDDAATYPTPPGTPDVDSPGYPGGDVGEDDQDTDVPPVADEPSSPPPDTPDTPVGESPAAPDVPAAGPETNPPSVGVPSSEGGSTVGEAPPTDTTPGEAPPTDEGPSGTETEGGLFAMGGGGCGLIPNNRRIP